MDKMSAKHRARHRQRGLQQPAVTDPVIASKAIDLTLVDPQRLFNLYKSDISHRNLLRQFLEDRFVAVFDLLHHSI